MGTKRATAVWNKDILTITAIETEEVLTFDINTLNDEMKLKLLKHGLKQKLCDSYAGAEPTEIFPKVSGVAKDLENGDWSSRVAGTGTPRTTQLAAALVAVTGQDMETVMAKLEDMSEDAKKELRKHDDIKKAILDIKAKEAADKAAAAAANPVVETSPINF